MCFNETSNSSQPSSTPNASQPANGTTQPCPSSKCNCCVTSVAIENVIYFGAAGYVDPTPPPMRFYNGHIFDCRIEMSFASGTSGTSDCAFEWWEKVDLPAHATHPAGVWTEMITVGSPGSPTFGPWTNRTVPCPGGGNLTVIIKDPPSLGSAPGRTVTRTLEFKLVAKSGTGCPCATTSATARATQVLVMVNGVLDATASSFTIGASSTTP